MNIRCGQCGQTLEAGSTASGGAIECPHCLHRIVVPAADHKGHPLPQPAGEEEEGFARKAMRAMRKKIVVECGKCGRRMSLNPGMAGKKVRCRSCHRTISVPDTDDDAELLLLAQRLKPAAANPPVVVGTRAESAFATETFQAAATSAPDAGLGAEPDFETAAAVILEESPRTGRGVATIRKAMSVLVSMAAAVGIVAAGLWICMMLTIRPSSGRDAAPVAGNNAPATQSQPASAPGPAGQ